MVSGRCCIGKLSQKDVSRFERAIQRMRPTLTQPGRPVPAVRRASLTRTWHRPMCIGRVSPPRITRRRADPTDLAGVDAPGHEHLPATSIVQAPHSSHSLRRTAGTSPVAVAADRNQLVVRDSEGHRHKRLTHMKPCDLAYPLMRKHVRLDPRERINTTSIDSGEQISAAGISTSGLHPRRCAQRLQTHSADALRDPLRGDMNKQRHSARQSSDDSTQLGPRRDRPRAGRPPSATRRASRAVRSRAPVGQNMNTPRAASHGIGSVLMPPGRSTSKCRCGPVELPRLPTFAIRCPADTRCPTETKLTSLWP